MCPNWWCTYSTTTSAKNLGRHSANCKSKYERGYRLSHKPGVYNPRNSHYVSIEEHGIAVEKISCKQEPISEESEVLPLSNPPSLEELPIPTDKPRTEDKATQYDLKPSQKVNQSALYAELLETTEAKIDIMLKLYKSYDKILEKFEHRLNKK